MIWSQVQIGLKNQLLFLTRLIKFFSFFNFLTLTNLHFSSATSQVDFPSPFGFYYYNYN
jgi:hypothetical protein